MGSSVSSLVPGAEEDTECPAAADETEQPPSECKLSEWERRVSLVESQLTEEAWNILALLTDLADHPYKQYRHLKESKFVS